jgi:hypothetical protein
MTAARTERAVAGADPALTDLAGGTGIPTGSTVEWIVLPINAEDLRLLLLPLELAGEQSRLARLPALFGVRLVLWRARASDDSQRADAEANEAAPIEMVAEDLRKAIEPRVIHGCPGSCAWDEEYQ